ncbi:hypothetical protein D1BOALGB6SA_3904 [Olavius sp. associated proteobacterium Delta 1]|nr:hypothetical protein D1BOALGB6SA_3904 [Olavius sp. associated proteobacterium Delta 1]
MIGFAETVKSLNVQHRTSNIEHRILSTLRFFDFKINGTTARENRSALISPPKRYTEPNFARQMQFARSLLIDRIPYSMLGVRCSMFIF